MIYLTDVTEFELLRQKYAKEKICLAYIRFDNYEDVMRGLSETNMANLNGEIHEMVTKWVAVKYMGFRCEHEVMAFVAFPQWLQGLSWGAWFGLVLPWVAWV